MIQRKIPNPYQSLYRTLIGAAFLMNIPAVIFMMSGEHVLTMYMGLAQFMMFFLGVALLIQGKQEVRGILRLLQEPLLAAWTYDRFHWEAFAQGEFQRQKSNAIVTMSVFLIAGPAVALTGYRNMTLIDGIALGVLLGIFAFGIGMLYARSILKRSKKPPFEAFISSSGAFVNGIFIDWKSSSVILHGTTIVDTDGTGVPALSLRYTVRGRYGRYDREMFVPIPEGKRDEAREVVKALEREIHRPKSGE